MEKDVYQLEVERLQAIPDAYFFEEVLDAWCIGHKHSPLFDIIGEGSTLAYFIGCLTQIKASEYRAAFIKGKPNKALTREIRKDERIPKGVEGITKESLPVFAEWQRKIKKMQK